MICIALTSSDVLMVTSNGEDLTLPNLNDLKQIEDNITIIHISDNEHVVHVGATTRLPANFTLVNIRYVLNYLDFDTAVRVIYYQQLHQYYTSHKYCGSCGNMTIRQTKNKFVFCEQCQHEIYPHIAPCIMVRIHRGDEILMARGVGFAKGRWGLIAGFLEIGETLEDCVVREVREEVGLEISDIEYVASQPWSFPSTTIMVGFTARYKSGEIVIDTTELLEAGFFAKNNMPGYPSSKYSLASKLINDFINEYPPAQ